MTLKDPSPCLQRLLRQRARLTAFVRARWHRGRCGRPGALEVRPTGPLAEGGDLPDPANLIGVCPNCANR